MFLIALLPVPSNLSNMRMSSHLTAARRRPPCRLEHAIHQLLAINRSKGRLPEKEVSFQTPGWGRLERHLKSPGAAPRPGINFTGNKVRPKFG